EPYAKVMIPIGVTPLAVFAESVSYPDSNHNSYFLGAATDSTHTQHTPFIASVEYQNQGDLNQVTIVVNDNPIH
ncbi:MAG: hypothetical protein EBX40_05650, partial [Gammaproteobacteria bacterium]|nr:hypothetical protein [Gammaproteobacteria bacterium]